MTHMYALRASRIITPFEVIDNGVIVTSGPTILAVGPASAIDVPRGTSVLDFGDSTIAPGFVDVHIHGSGGDTAMDGAEAVERISRFIARHGTTTWLPTLTSKATVAETADVVRSCVEGARRSMVGAEAAGIHLEGPFLSPKRPGAIRPEWFRQPSVTDLDGLLNASPGWVRLMTLAPELPGGSEVVQALVRRGATASIGHSDATVDQAVEAIDGGVTHATHLFNAMRGLHQRDPGVVGAVLTSDRVRAELIADGIHVHPIAMSSVFRAKGPSRVVIVTDAVAPAGLGDGDYEFDGRPIAVKSGRATLADGTIAGSVGVFDDNFRRVIRDCGVSLREALLMSSTVPAQAAALANRKGSLTGGRDADIIVLDHDLKVIFTMTRGQIAFQAD